MENVTGYEEFAMQTKVVVEPVVDIKKENVINITTVSDLQVYAKGKIVELPGFGEGQPFVCRLQRVSMLIMAKEGKIPNSLMTTANDMFTKGKGDSDDEDLLKNMYDVMQEIAKASLLQPTFEEVEESGIKLTDEQLMAIFNYSQKGIKALEPFRQE